uniref:Uncharacterized protein n=1 Tax=Hucho hucho TaxID=62062 RepID=A0A4W5LKH9_9TELE
MVVSLKHVGITDSVRDSWLEDYRSAKIWNGKVLEYSLLSRRGVTVSTSYGQPWCVAVPGFTRALIVTDPGFTRVLIVTVPGFTRALIVTVPGFTRVLIVTDPGFTRVLIVTDPGFTRVLIVTDPGFTRALIVTDPGFTHSIHLTETSSHPDSNPITETSPRP